MHWHLVGQQHPKRKNSADLADIALANLQVAVQHQENGVGVQVKEEVEVQLPDILEVKAWVKKKVRLLRRAIVGHLAKKKLEVQGNLKAEVVVRYKVDHVVGV